MLPTSVGRLSFSYTRSERLSSDIQCTDFTDVDFSPRVPFPTEIQPQQTATSSGPCSDFRARNAKRDALTNLASSSSKRPMVSWQAKS